MSPVNEFSMLVVLQGRGSHKSGVVSHELSKVNVPSKDLLQAVPSNDVLLYLRNEDGRADWIILTDETGSGEAIVDAGTGDGCGIGNRCLEARDPDRLL
jgi:hypothetical protein